MMQSELLQPAWPNFNLSCSTLQETDFFGVDDIGFSCSFASPEDSSVISSNSCVPTLLRDNFFDLEELDDEIQLCSSAMEGLESPTSSGDIEWWINREDTKENFPSPLTMEGDDWSPCLSFEFPLMEPSLLWPRDDMEVDDEKSLLHLLKAYGEAMENRENELAEVIVKSINRKSSPSGNTMERVAYSLFLSRDNQGEYLRQESSKTLLEAFKVLYQNLPNGRIAHFTANSAILESIPYDAATIQIVDFNMGEGIQWPPLIEAMSKKQKAMKLISIRSQGESTFLLSSFEDTKKWLQAHARQYGTKLQIEDFCTDLRVNRRGRGRDWLVFNCMDGLPHMGRRRPRKSVDEFLRVAEEFLPDFGGILILGDGEAKENLNCCGYSYYFDTLLRHHQAVFESLERNFPVYLAEARTAMESLFLAPFMCPLAWFKEWEETTKTHDHQTEVTRLEGRKMSLESLAEAKQMVVDEGENSYNVKVEGQRGNEMVLRWKETPLVRVSTWM